MARRKAATPPPVSELRGVVSFDTNEILALVLAPVEPVAEAFRKRRKAKTWTKNVGGKTVTATGITLGGASASNYTLSSTTATTTANILAATVTASVTAANKAGQLSRDVGSTAR